MGLKGLTTYMENRKSDYSLTFKLHDCPLVINEGCLCKLTNINAFYFERLQKSSFAACCYGGDYDKYEQIFKEFMKALKECNITPYFVCKGSKRIGTSALQKELMTTGTRLKNTQNMSPDLIRRVVRVKSKANMRKSNSGCNELVYPVGLKYTFRDVMSDIEGLNIVFTHNSETNNTAAQLAEYLKCPLLGENSDYFICVSKYIPLTSVNFNVQSFKENSDSKESSKVYKYLPCELYAREKLFINNKKMYYLLPVLIGSGTNKREIFSAFFQKHLYGNLPYLNEWNLIPKIFQWLEKQDSIEQVIAKILSSFESEEEKDNILSKIQDIINDYTPISVNSILEHFGLDVNLDLDLDTDNMKEQIIDFQKIRSDLGLKIREMGDSDYLSSDSISILFMQKFVNGQYPDLFLKMLQKNSYTFQTCIDDFTKPDSNTVAFPILAAIHQILVQDSTKRLTITYRSNSSMTKKVLPPYGEPAGARDSLPCIEEIEYELSQSERRDILLKVLEFNDDISNICEHFPDEWHIFIISIMYCKKNIADFDNIIIYPLIVNFLVLNYVDLKFDGFYRTQSDLRYLSPPYMDKDSSSLGGLGAQTKNKELFSNMSEIDLKWLLFKIIYFYEMKSHDTSQTFDRSIMHTLSEFNSLFLHLKFLNKLLNSPFKDGRLSKVYNGTFLYNVRKYIKHKEMENPKNYFNNSFKRLPTVLSVFNFVCEQLEV